MNCALASRFAALVLVALVALATPAPVAGRAPTPEPLAAQTPAYVVNGPVEDLAPPPPGVRVVLPFAGGALVSGPAPAVESLAERGFDLVRLPDGTSELPRWPPAARSAPPPALASPPPTPTPDPVVAALVASMSASGISATIQRLEDFGTRVSSTDSCLAAANYLAARFAALGLAVELYPFPLGDITACNVIAEKPGIVRPEEIYILSGHYDSMSGLPLTDAPGADDDASGTAAVLECARVLAPVSCAATIRFIAFSGEEQGLIGSRHYVENRVIPLNEDVRGVVNLDMIAFVHPYYPEWDANWYTDSTVSAALAQHVGDCVAVYTDCALHLVVQGTPTYGSDHLWFALNGYPAVFDIDAQFRTAPDWNYNYHTPNDRLVTLDLDYATEMARGALAAVAELAEPQTPGAVTSGEGSAPGPIVRVGPNPSGGSVTFDLGAGAMSVRIVDAGGRVVATLAGHAWVTWSGRGAGGDQTPPGVYFYAIDSGTQALASGKLILLR